MTGNTSQSAAIQEASTMSTGRTDFLSSALVSMHPSLAGDTRRSSVHCLLVETH